MALKQLSVDAAVQAIRQGDIIAYPTEAVYGLGCDPLNESSVDHLLTMKGRSRRQGLILIGSRLEQFKDLISWPDASQRQQLRQQQSPTSWVVGATDQAPGWITGCRPSIAIRISHHPVCQALCMAFGGPLVSTSANPKGESPARSVDQLDEYFPAGLAGVVEGQLGDLRQPTSIRDLATGQWLRRNPT